MKKPRKSTLKSLDQNFDLTFELWHHIRHCTALCGLASIFRIMIVLLNKPGFHWHYFLEVLAQYKSIPASLTQYYVSVFRFCGQTCGTLRLQASSGNKEQTNVQQSVNTFPTGARLNTNNFLFCLSWLDQQGYQKRHAFKGVKTALLTSRQWHRAVGRSENPGGPLVIQGLLMQQVFL